MPSAVVLLVAVLIPPAFAQTMQSGVGQAQPGPPQRPGAPPRDAAAATKPGTGTIKGRVTSADGRPLRRAQVRVTATELRDPRTVSTDSEGVFEIGELPAARYTIRVSRSGYLPLVYGQRYPEELGKPVQLADGATISGIDLILPRAGIIAGRINDEVGDPIAGVSVYAMQQRYFQGRRRLVPTTVGNRTDDTGQYRLIGLAPGEYFVFASIRESWVVGKEKMVMSFAPTYYPGVTNPATAQRVKVGLGAEVPAIDFALALGRAATVSGTAWSSAGAPMAGGRISLDQEVRGPGMASMQMIASATAAADGSWKITNVPPGEYKLQLRSADTKSQEGVAMPLNTEGADIEGITLAAAMGGTVAGHVVVEGEVPVPIPLTRLRVQGRPVNDAAFLVGVRPQQSGAVDEQGAFQLDDLIGGQRLAVTGLPDGWAVKAIERDTTDLTDANVQLKSGERWDGLRITLTNRLTTITGTLTTDRDERSPSGTIVVFADDRALWGEASRHVRGVRPTQAGEYEIKGLPPGTYRAIAVEYIPDGDWFDVEVLESLRDQAIRFTLAEAETRSVNLKLNR